MALTPEQKQVLITISSKLNKAFKSENRPVICYALDEDFISSREYELIKDCDLCINAADYAKYFLGAVLLWVRNFYETSDGGDCWNRTNGLEVEKRAKFQEWLEVHEPWRQCAEFMKLSKDPIRWVSWIRSQCWIIKSSNQSDVVAHNRNLYQKISGCSVFDFVRGWNELKDDDFNLLELDCETADDLQDYISSVPYLQYIWKNYKKEYLLSLRAIVSTKDQRQDVDNWLKPLIGVAPSAVKYNYSWCLLTRCDKSLSPALVLDSEFRDAKICQGQLEVYSSSCVYHLWYLIDKGFDLSKEIEIISKDKYVVSKIPSPLVQGCILFRTRRNKDVLQSGTIIGGGSFYLFYSSFCDAPCVAVDDVVLVEDTPIESVPQQLKCLEYRIPYLPQQQVKNLLINNQETGVRVNTRPRIVLCNPCDVSLIGNSYVVDSHEVHFYAYGLRDVTVNGEQCHEVEDGSCYYHIELDQNCGELNITGRSVHDDKKCSVSVLSLPKDWKKRCEYDDWRLVRRYAGKRKNYVKYTSPDGGSYHLLYPLEHAFCIWRNSRDENVLCLDTEQYNSGEYRAYVYPGNEDGVVTVMDGCSMHELPLKYGRQDLLSELFNALIDKIELNSYVKVHIGEQLVYEGKFLPNCCCIMKDRLYCHCLQRNFELHVRHELCYATDIRPFYQRYELNAMEWNESFVAALPSLPQEWPKGKIQYILMRDFDDCDVLAEFGKGTQTNEWNYHIVSAFLSTVKKGLEHSMLPVRWFADKLKVSVKNYDYEFLHNFFGNELWRVKMNRLMKQRVRIPVITEVQEIPTDILLCRQEMVSLLDKVMGYHSQEHQGLLLSKWNIIREENHFERMLFLTSLIVNTMQQTKVTLTEKELQSVCVFCSSLRYPDYRTVESYLAYVAESLPCPLKTCAVDLVCIFSGLINQVERIDACAADGLKTSCLPNDIRPWSGLVNNLIQSKINPSESPIWQNVKDALENEGLSTRSVIIAALYWHLSKRYDAFPDNQIVYDSCRVRFEENGLFHDEYRRMEEYFHKLLD